MTGIVHAFRWWPVLHDTREAVELQPSLLTINAPIDLAVAMSVLRALPL